MKFWLDLANKSEYAAHHLTEEESDDRLQSAAQDVEEELPEGSSVTSEDVRRLLDVPQVLGVQTERYKAVVSRILLTAVVARTVSRLPWLCPQLCA